MLQSTKEETDMSIFKKTPKGGINHIPMSSVELPQQRLYEVKALPILPAGYSVEITGYETQHTLPGIPKKPTKKSISLAQVEWAWSPMHARIDGYQVHQSKEHWLLWCGGPDDNVCPNTFNWFAVACMPVKGVSQADAGIHLLSAFWNFEAGSRSLDQYHWINHCGILSVSDIQSIAEEVWSAEEK